MTSQDLHHQRGSGEGTGAESKWQKHVMVGLWILLLVLAGLLAFLLHTKTHGSFQPTARHTTPVTAWPDN